MGGAAAVRPKIAARVAAFLRGYKPTHLRLALQLLVAYACAFALFSPQPVRA